jgi:serine/threonine-protein phosphatase 6 regulatory subunit 3
MLSPSHPPDLHAVVSDVLKGIIALCAPSPGNANDQIALVANRFSRQLASQEIATLLVGYMLGDVTTTTASISSKSPQNTMSDATPALSVLQDAPQTHESEIEIKVTEDDDARSISSVSSLSSSSSRSEYHSIISSPSERSTSSLIHVASVIIELMRKNNSDFFEPYLFHTIRQRLIHIQQQYLPQLERPEMDAEQRAEDDRFILERAMADMTDQMGIVNFGPLLSTLTARLPQFQALLKNPRSLVR